jgi:hypothetical protein
MTFRFTFRPSAIRMALGLLAMSSSVALAQDIPDRLELHASLNAGYGRASALPVFGIPLTGTSDYRVFTVQGRYSLSENDQLVAQVFNRRLGTSPLASAISDVTMQWAYFQHKTGDVTVKIGRNPLPRGMFNEVRYIGTVLPFFRPANEVTGEAFDALDGAVVTYRHSLPLGLELEQHGFVGGSEQRSIAATSTGQEVRIARAENLFGGQTFMTLPVAGLRVGAYGARYNFNQATARGYRTNVILSAEATPFERLKLDTEHGRITGDGPANDNRAGDYQATFRLTSRLSVAGQHVYKKRMLYFANADLNQMFDEVKSDGASLIVGLTSNSVLKVENHWSNGYSYDTSTPVIASQTATSVTLNDPQAAHYFLVSIAASF